MKNKDCVILKISEYNDLLAKVEKNKIYIHNMYHPRHLYERLNSIDISVSLGDFILSEGVSKQIKKITNLIETSLISKLQEDLNKLLEKQNDVYNDGLFDGERKTYKKLANMSWYERRKELKKWKDN